MHKAAHVFDKTKLCAFYAKGLCTRGQNCVFAHTMDQLQPQPNLYRTKLCSNYMRHGGCDAGDNCNFAHSQEELRPLIPIASCANQNKMLELGQHFESRLATEAEAELEFQLLGAAARSLFIRNTFIEVEDGETFHPWLGRSKSLPTDLQRGIDSPTKTPYPRHGGLQAGIHDARSAPGGF